jgi:histidinol-phosphate aminotransferase
MSKHAFAVYKIVTQACGAKALEVPMIDWRHDLKSFNNYIEEDTKVIFVANPNNPTGTFNSHEDFKSMMLSIPKSTLVVLDLAYYEYVEADDYILLKPFQKYKDLQALE